MDSPYEDGRWTINVQLPKNYPYSSPSIGFVERIYHPNIDLKFSPYRLSLPTNFSRSGTVCLDVINQTWSPMFDLINIFDVFIPQLLQYPNAKDPLNTDAALTYIKDKKEYEKKVRNYVKGFAAK